MELRAFAEKILFSTTLEEKLAAPCSPITDEEPGAAVGSPDVPGRPGSLRFASSKGNSSDFSKARHLESDEDRATLLHFFANHELLATELMALVLLKFPNAPKDFRTGILETLLEEQGHTQMYMRRMAACGVSFGDQPVNGFIWRSIASMDSPLDYVTRLSLTFEQANLDYAHHFATVFRKSGDGTTATILDKIYRDEITHVGYGLKWFREWKDKGSSDWDAYKRQLSFPMSPHRAKGKAPFNREGRLAAGLDEAFIRELEVSTSSRGRTPDVYLFNPQAEESVAQNGADFTASKDSLTLCHDLETLVLYLSKEDDAALLRRRPSVAFLGTLKEAGITLPEIVELTPEGKVPPGSDLLVRKLGKLRPWGWSPDSTRTLKPIAAQAIRFGAANGWDPELEQLYSKSWSAEILRELVASETSLPLIPVNHCGRSASSADAVARALAVFQEMGFPTVALKAAFGVSGRAMLQIKDDTISSDRIQGWIANALKRHRCLVVEPWFDRTVDLSIQYEIQRTGDDLRVIFKGTTRLQNDARGQFRSCTVGKRFFPRVPPEIDTFLHALPQQEGWARKLFQETIPALLGSRLQDSSFEGPLGIDAFVYSDAKRSLQLQPIVEVNPRFTIGRVAVELGRHLQPGAHGSLEIVPASKLGELDPVRTIRHGETLKMAGGTLALTEPSPESRFAALWRVD